jgi:predicted GNAT superfamily acetyltransferase
VIEIRAPKTIEEFNALETLQLEIWQTTGGLIAGEMLFVAYKNGGIVLAAYDMEKDPTKPVGFVFSIVGYVDGKLRQHSHMAGVHHDYRDKNLGYKLKLAQREVSLKQGITWMIWTCDPLESRNANFNFRKLGAICNTYYEHLYGDMEGINEGLPSDRFQPDWFLNSEHVVRCLQGENLRTFADLKKVSELLEAPNNKPLSQVKLSQLRILLEIPADFRAIKMEDKPLALEWRLFLREIFQRAFADGYSVTDFLIEQGRGYYFLEKTGSSTE